MRTSNGSGGFTAVSAYENICNLNNQFQAANMFFYMPDSIRFINNNDYFNALTFDSLFAMINNSYVPRTVNIYFTNLSQLGLCGFATLPNPGPPPAGNDDGAIVMSFSCSGPNNPILAHEAGHYFGLPHTFEGTASFPNQSFAELVTRNPNETGGRLSANCNTAGDRFCDTPADFIASRWACPRSPANQANDFNGDAFQPDSSMFMSYAADPCMSRFSEQQMLVMRETLNGPNNPRGRLLDVPMPNYGVITTSPAQLYPLAPDTVIPNYAVFRWKSIPNADFYQLRIYVQNFTVLDTTLSDTSFISTGSSIRQNREHLWEVRGLNGANLCTPYTNRQNFYAGPFSLNAGVRTNPLNQIRVYPSFLRNHEPLHIKSLPGQTEVQLIISSLSGNIVYQTQLFETSDIASIKLPELSEGLYILQLEQNQNFFRQKIVIIP
ncbi:MAG: zinc-dependent metalloprotease [Bacteroidia bacterium]